MEDEDDIMWDDDVFICQLLAQLADEDDIMWDDDDFNPQLDDDEVIEEYTPPEYEGPYAGEGGIDF